jgi:hypothetical protein
MPVVGRVPCPDAVMLSSPQMPNLQKQIRHRDNP